MEMHVELLGQDATEPTVLALRDWIHREQIPDLRVDRSVTPPKAGKMGVDPGTLLSIILGSAAVVQLVKSIHVWLQTRKPKVRIQIKVGAASVDIDGENLPDLQHTIDKVLMLAETQRP